MLLNALLLRLLKKQNASQLPPFFFFPPPLFRNNGEFEAKKHFTAFGQPIQFIYLLLWKGNFSGLFWTIVEAKVNYQEISW